jgi:hypothetical protein
MRSEEVDASLLVEALVTAILSVNNWPLGKTFAIREQLSQHGLFDASVLSTASDDALMNRLALAGYNRGPFLIGTMATRLHSLGELLTEGGLERMTELARRRDIAGVKAMLRSVHGIGPVVLAHFEALEGSGK